MVNCSGIHKIHSWVVTLSLQPATNKLSKAIKIFISKLQTKELKIVFGVLVGLRLFYSVTALLTYNVFPIDKAVNNLNFYHNEKPITGFSYWIIGIWQRWDVIWYTQIARQGYTPDLSVAYGPVYPSLIKLCSNIIPVNPVAITLILSFISSLGAFLLLFQLYKAKFSNEAALKGLFWYLLFPFSFYFLNGYSESLLLFLSVLSWYEAYKGRSFISSLTALLAVLTKPSALVLIPSLIWLTSISNSKQISFSWKVVLKARNLFFIIPFAGLALWYTYLTRLFAHTGAEYIGARVLTNPISSLINGVINSWGTANSLNLFQLLTVIVILCMVIGLWKFLSGPERLYICLLFVATLAEQPELLNLPLGNAPRHLLLLFPVFMAAGNFKISKKNDYALVATALILSISLITLYVHWWWVS